MDGVYFDADNDEEGEEDGEYEASAEYEDEDVMDSAIEGENETGTSTGGKHKPWSKPSRSGVKRQRNRSWKGGKRVAASDDEFVPHPFGEGVCKEWHFRDDVTEQPYVKVMMAEDEVGEERREETLTLVAGEGIAIGRQPCEFHRNEFGERC
jgi:hypothetical protein